MANNKGAIDGSIVSPEAVKAMRGLLSLLDDGLDKLKQYEGRGSKVPGGQRLNELEQASNKYKRTLELTANEQLRNIAQLKEAERLQRTLASEVAKTTQSQSNNAKAIAAERLQRQQNNKLIKEEAELTSQFTGAYRKLQIQRNRALRTLKDLAANQDASNDEIREAQREFDKLNARYITANRLSGNYSDNVGNYPKTFKGAIGAVRQLVGVFGLVEGIRVAGELSAIAREARGVEFAFNRLGPAGVEAFEEIQERTRGLISDLEIQRSLVEFNNLGIQLETTGVAFEFLAVRAAQTGRSIESLRGDLVTGLGRGSVRILDNLGLSMSELNRLTKEQGLSIQEAFGVVAQREIENAGGILDEAANGSDRFNASLTDLKVTLGEIINSFKALGFFSDLIEDIDGYFEATRINSEATNIRLRRQNIELVSVRATLARVRDTFRQLNEETRNADALLVEEEKRRRDVIKSLNDQADAIESVRSVLGPQEASEIEFQALANQAASLVEIVEKEKEKNDEKKKGLAILEGSQAFYENQIKNLTELQRKTASNTEEFIRYEKQIAEAQRSISQIRNGIDSLQKVEGFDFPVNIQFEDPEAQIDDFEAALFDRQVELAEQSKSALNAINSGILLDTEQFTDQQLEILEEAAQKRKDLETQTQREIQNIAVKGLSSIFNSRVEAVDREIEANREALRQIEEDDRFTEEQKLDAKRAFAEQEAKLQDERRKRERQAFLVEKAFAVGQIAIDLARTISTINAAAAKLDLLFPIPPGAAGAAYRAINIPKAVGLAATQVASVAAQAIPGFFKGKGPLDKYEGPAWVNEKPGQREVGMDKDGNLDVFDKGPHIRKVKRDDLIFKSVRELERQMTNPRTEAFKRVRRKLKDESFFRDQLTKKGIEQAIMKGMRRSSIQNTVNVVVRNKRRGYLH